MKRIPTTLLAVMLTATAAAATAANNPETEPTTAREVPSIAGDAGTADN